MNRILNLCFLALLVSGLSAGLTHDVAHAQGEHTELCDVFKTDNSVGVHYAVASTPAHSYQPASVDYYAAHSKVTYRGLSWSQRAPPLTI